MALSLLLGLLILPAAFFTTILLPHHRKITARLAGFLDAGSSARELSEEQERAIGKSESSQVAISDINQRVSKLESRVKQSDSKLSELDDAKRSMWWALCARAIEVEATIFLEDLNYLPELEAITNEEQLSVATKEFDIYVNDLVSVSRFWITSSERKLRDILDEIQADVKKKLMENEDNRKMSAFEFDLLQKKELMRYSLQRVVKFLQHHLEAAIEGQNNYMRTVHGRGNPVLYMRAKKRFQWRSLAQDKSLAAHGPQALDKEHR